MIKITLKKTTIVLKQSNVKAISTESKTTRHDGGCFEDTQDCEDSEASVSHIWKVKNEHLHTIFNLDSIFCYYQMLRYFNN